jgi:uncharacterized protein (DUF427 family)
MSETQEKAEVIRSDKWVRAYLGNEVVADSRNTKLLRGHGQIAIYYFPEEDVKLERLELSDSDQVAEQGEGPWPEPPPHKKVYDVRVNGTIAKNAGWQVEESAEFPQLAGHFGFAWQEMDAWYEEDEQIRFHPHDPYHLIDVRPSSRHIKVSHRGQVLAETKRPVILFEAGLPPRFYIPKVDVRMDMLALSDKTTHCAYKGIASYYSVHLADGSIERDIAWFYPYPSPAYPLIQNMIAFPHEGVDELLVDGKAVNSEK